MEHDWKFIGVRSSNNYSDIESDWVCNICNINRSTKFVYDNGPVCPETNNENECHEEIVKYVILS